MAGDALDEHARMSLARDALEIVIALRARKLRMRRSVAGLAGETAVTYREAIQRKAGRRDIGIRSEGLVDGTDYRGTVLSRSQADRTLSTEGIGTKRFWRGFQIGCYTCHLGPRNSDPNPNSPAVVTDSSASMSAEVPVAVPLGALDPDGGALVVRIVSQPSHGTVGLQETVATYFPEAGFVGIDTFTFAAWDGSTDSNLATVSVSVEAVATPTPTPAPVSCAGDCNGSGDVSIDELITMVDIALGSMSVESCDPGDVDGNGQITVDEIVSAVNRVLHGCGP